MKPREIINGSEKILDPGQPRSALIQFYQAFNSQNLELMQANWLQTDDASLANPLGGLKRGWNEIRQVYERIFFGPITVHVEFHDLTVHKHGPMFVAVGKERGHLTVADIRIELAIRTSRIYLMDNDRWRQLHHHGSIDDPGLLDRYQTLVFSQR